MSKKRTNQPVLLFDGKCNLCSSWVDLIITLDSEGHVLLGALQSKAAENLLFRVGFRGETLDSLVLIENDKVFTRSSAALRLTKHLSGPIGCFYYLIFMPKPVRDFIYNLIAKNRYRLFGRMESCRTPKAGTEDRFIDGQHGGRVSL